MKEIPKIVSRELELHKEELQPKGNPLRKETHGLDHQSRSLSHDKTLHRRKPLLLKN